MCSLCLGGADILIFILQILIVIKNHEICTGRNVFHGISQKFVYFGVDLGQGSLVICP